MKELKKLLGILILLGIFSAPFFCVEIEVYLLSLGISALIIGLIILAHYLMFSE